jgi:hypothetical protein
MRHLPGSWRSAQPSEGERRALIGTLLVLRATSTAGDDKKGHGRKRSSIGALSLEEGLNRPTGELFYAIKEGRFVEPGEQDHDAPGRVAGALCVEFQDAHSRATR